MRTSDSQTNLIIVFSVNYHVMKLLFVCFLIATLALISSALPLDKKGEPATCKPPAECKGGTYETCTADVVCIQSYPEGCHCQNEAKKKCASACGEMDPKFNDCSISTYGGDTPQR